MPAHDLDIHLTTAYSAYDIRDVIYDGRAARVMYSSSSHTAQSGLARDGGNEELFDYNERLMELVRGLRPASVLLIGGGAFVLPRAIIRSFPDTSLTVVEIDPDLPGIATRYFDFSPSPRTTIHIGDGYEFLRHDDSTYDLILLDVFSEASIPPAFRSPEIAGLLRQHLRPQAIVAMNLIASYRGRHSVLLRRQIAVLKSSFDHLQLFPAGHNDSTWYPENFILTAGTTDADLSSYLRFAAKPLPISS